MTDDLISRQQVKDIFTELYGISAIGSAFDKYEWADICETTANELPSIQPEAKWIPVEEKLPEPWTLVLVTDSCKNVSVCQMAFNPSDGWYNEYENWTYFSTSVIAWMPLPEPYQKRGE